MLEIRDLPLSDVLEAEYNPRVALKPGDPEYEALKRSVGRWGLVEPLVWNKRNGNLVGGHQRLAVLRAEGVESVQVSVVDLDDADERALNVALNQIGGDWDMPKLTELMQGLSEVRGYDETLTGFDVNEIAKLLEGGDAVDDPVAPVVPADPKCNPGAVYKVGPHILMCGDPTDPDDVAKLLHGVEPHLMVTSVQSAESPEGWPDVWRLFPGMVAYVWHAPGPQQVAVHDSLVAADFEPRQQIVWPTQSPQSAESLPYQYQHEPCWYAVKKGGKGFWSGGRSQSSVWEIESDLPPGRQKPLECMTRPIVNNSSPGQAVYDPFGGTGTTLIAAHRAARVCYVMEPDPGLCDVIRARFRRERRK